jgi:hypothetical protein
MYKGIQQSFQKQKSKWLINEWRNSNILSHKGNENQNYTEIQSHFNQNGHDQENRQQQMLVGMCVRGMGR